MAEDGDDVAAEVLVVRTQSNTPRSGTTANTSTTADILKVLDWKNKNCFKCLLKAWAQSYETLRDLFRRLISVT